MKEYEKSLLERHVDTYVLGVFVRLRLDLTQTGNELFVIRLDALESLCFICRPRGNKTIDTIDGVRSGRVEREIGKRRYGARPTVDLCALGTLRQSAIPKGYKNDSRLR